MPAICVRSGRDRPREASCEAQGRRHRRGLSQRGARPPEHHLVGGPGRRSHRGIRAAARPIRLFVSAARRAELAPAARSVAFAGRSAAQPRLDAGESPARLVGLPGCATTRPPPDHPRSGGSCAAGHGDSGGTLLRVSSPECALGYGRVRLDHLGLAFLPWVHGAVRRLRHGGAAAALPAAGAGRKTLYRRHGEFLFLVLRAGDLAPSLCADLPLPPVALMATRPQEPEPWTRIAAQWFCFLGPPLAAFGEQQFSYVLVDPACHAHAPLLLQLPPLLA